jgi:hydroxypyruvate isomerase
MERNREFMSTSNKNNAEIERIIEAAHNMQRAADAAHDAAINLNARILNTEKMPELRLRFVSDTALIRDSANFLQHLVQTFDYRLSPALTQSSRRKR